MKKALNEDNAKSLDSKTSVNGGNTKSQDLKPLMNEDNNMKSSELKISAKENDSKGLDLENPIKEDNIKISDLGNTTKDKMKCSKLKPLVKKIKDPDSENIILKETKSQDSQVNDLDLARNILREAKSQDSLGTCHSKYSSRSKHSNRSSRSKRSTSSRSTSRSKRSTSSRSSSLSAQERLGRKAYREAREGIAGNSLDTKVTETNDQELIDKQVYLSTKLQSLSKEFEGICEINRNLLSPKESLHKLFTLEESREDNQLSNFKDHSETSRKPRLLLNSGRQLSPLKESREADCDLMKTDLTLKTSHVAALKDSKGMHVHDKFTTGSSYPNGNSSITTAVSAASDLTPIIQNGVAHVINQDGKSQKISATPNASSGAPIIENNLKDNPNTLMPTCLKHKKREINARKSKKNQGMVRFKPATPGKVLDGYDSSEEIIGKLTSAAQFRKKFDEELARKIPDKKSNSQPINTNGSFRLQCLNKDGIRSIFSREKFGESTLCSMCFKNFVEGKIIVTSKSGYHYHQECVDSWNKLY
mmetsp:Transcript_17927/g.35764  ORF Transcript_17927/g.35764 Transcript_17927/m.35764 type:complete len:532 (+) Transcript_17927:2-1597(+)